MLFLLLGSACLSAADERGASVVVVYNVNVPESKELAEYYASRRKVPAAQLFGLDLPKEETISRKAFRERLQEPLLEKLAAAKLIEFSNAKGGRKAKSDKPPLPASAKIRYLTLCYGVPLKIESDPRLAEKESEKIRKELMRNEAAVDNELALLPLSRFKVPLYGLVANPAYGATNSAVLHPTNGVLMVARLDGPSAAVARGLVDKALAAERMGLWGRAYFDARGLTNGPSKAGDDWIKASAEVLRRLGYETVVDDRDERFSAAFPMSHIAFYAGWYEYDGQVSGPFKRSAVEFMPGAFAYHLHSFGAASLRSAEQHWAGPLLARGATATLGTVYEPYLEFTVHLPTFFHRWIHLGLSFGEAAYAALPVLSWQTTVVGDPLFRPFGMKPQELHERLVGRKEKLAEWSHLKVVNINLATDLPPPDLIEYLESLPELNQSAVLLEKLGDLQLATGRTEEGIRRYQAAIAVTHSEQQRIRLMLRAAQWMELSGQVELAYAVYQEFVRKHDDYAGLRGIYERLVTLAERLDKPADKASYSRQLER